MASGDVVSLLAGLAMVKQELPTNALVQMNSEYYMQMN